MTPGPASHRRTPQSRVTLRPTTPRLADPRCFQHRLATLRVFALRASPPLLRIAPHRTAAPRCVTRRSAWPRVATRRTVALRNASFRSAPPGYAALRVASHRLDFVCRFSPWRFASRRHAPPDPARYRNSTQRTASPLVASLRCSTHLNASPRPRKGDRPMVSDPHPCDPIAAFRQRGGVIKSCPTAAAAPGSGVVAGDDRTRLAAHRDQRTATVSFRWGHQKERKTRKGK